MKYTDLKKRLVSHTMIYGNSGTGKSTLIAQLAEAGFNLLWISCDNGHTVIDKLSDEAKSRIEIVVLPDTAEFPVAIVTCLKISSGGKCHICDNHGQIDCQACKLKLDATWTDVCLNETDPSTIVVYDHLSQVADSAIAFVTNGKPENYKLDYDDWSYVWKLMSKLLSNIQQSKQNVAAVALAVQTKFEDNTTKLVPQVGSDRFSGRVGAYFDHIILCEVGNLKHKFGSATTYSASAMSKSRTDVSIEKESIPSLKPFFDGTIGKAPEYGSQTASTIASLGSTSTVSSSPSVGDDVMSKLRGLMK